MLFSLRANAILYFLWLIDASQAGFGHKLPSKSKKEGGKQAKFHVRIPYGISVVMCKPERYCKIIMPRIDDSIVVLVQGKNVFYKITVQ